MKLLPIIDPDFEIIQGLKTIAKRVLDSNYANIDKGQISILKKLLIIKSQKLTIEVLQEFK